MDKVVLGIKKHILQNYVIVPFVIDETDHEFCKIKDILFKSNIKQYKKLINPVFEQIIELTDKYSDRELYRKFSRKNVPITKFFTTLENKYKDLIISYIDKYQKQVLDLAIEYNIPLYLKPHLYENIYSEDRVYYNKEIAQAIFHFERNTENLKYNLKIHIDGKNIDIFKKKIIVLVNHPAYLIVDKNLIRFEDIDGKKFLPFATKEYISVPRKLEKKYLSSFVRNIIQEYDVEAEGFIIRKIKNYDKKALLYVRESINGNIIFVPKFRYFKKEIPYNTTLKNIVFFDDQNIEFSLIQREKQWEKRLLNSLKQLGLVEQDNYYIIAKDTVISDVQKQHTINWLNENKTQIENIGFEIIMQTQKNYFIDKLDLKIEVKEKIDWFDIYMTVEFNGYKFPFIKLQDYILKGIKEFPLPNGQIAIIPDSWFERYKKILFLGKKEQGIIKLKKTQVFAFEEEEIKHLKLPSVDRIKSFLETAQRIPSLPKNLNAQLRKYQLEGYAWLNALQEYNFGGCLVDDMGLGKTIQTIAILQKTIEQNLKPTTLFDKQSDIQFLIIVPTSLIHNWEKEIKKFVKKPKILLYIGNDRKKLINQISKNNFILTTYGLVRNDFEILNNFKFYYIVLDESHVIKNPYSKTYNAIIRLKARHKLVLTGTPIENSLRDLWTQMNFVNPELLGSLKFFNDNFITPIEKNDDQNTKDELKKIITPFILRRTKEEVFDDLPELDEQTIICEMEDEQASIYQTERTKIRNQLLEYYNTGQLKRSSVIILQAMSKLRQLANHPGLIYQDKEYKSGKFEEILLRLETLIDKNHKVLVFSSFVKILNIFKNEFDNKGWKYQMLIGQSKNRKQIIDEFQNYEDIKLFLISLKAGGVGLNLTAADYVFLIDPWWNPQAERQAISRAHRMGQTKKVFVQRFITYNTIEEKIQQLQQKKLKLSHEFIDSNNLFKVFSDDSILELFS